MKVIAKVTSHTQFRNGVEMVSFDLYYPRMIHAQFLTHRRFSRNSRSSRAMSVENAIEDILQNPVQPYPVVQGRGMIPTEDAGSLDMRQVRRAWHNAEGTAIMHARRLAGLGVHAEIANRVLEPFMHIATKLTTTVEHLREMAGTRTKGDSQKPFDMLARAMLEAVEASTPTVRRYHLPYDSGQISKEGFRDEILAQVAWGARVSYDGTYATQDKERNVKLAKRLVRDGHWSPLEHIAVEAEIIEGPLLCGNFPKGVIQFRQAVQNCGLEATFKLFESQLFSEMRVVLGRATPPVEEPLTAPE